QKALPALRSTTPDIVMARVTREAMDVWGSAVIDPRSAPRVEDRSATAARVVIAGAGIAWNTEMRYPPKAPTAKYLSAPETPATYRRERSGWDSGPVAIAAVMAAMQTPWLPKGASTVESVEIPPMRRRSFTANPS